MHPLGEKRIKFNKTSREDLQILVTRSKTFTELASYFNMKFKGRYFETIKNRLDKDGIDYCHILTGLDSTKGKKIIRINPIPLESVMVEY